MEKFMAGRNPVHIEGDVVLSICLEDTDAEGIRQFFEIVEPVFAKYGRALLLTDATRNVSVSAEARRMLAEWSKTHRVVTAIFGPGITTRAMLTLITRAMNLLGKNTEKAAFFATEAEARAWLDEQRREFLTKHPEAPR